jgi:MYXO-CTERM domain-containing protein
MKMKLSLLAGAGALLVTGAANASLFVGLETYYSHTTTAVGPAGGNFDVYHVVANFSGQAGVALAGAINTPFVLTYLDGAVGGSDGAGLGVLRLAGPGITWSLSIPGVGSGFRTSAATIYGGTFLSTGGDAPGDGFVPGSALGLTPGSLTESGAQAPLNLWSDAATPDWNWFIVPGGAPDNRLSAFSAQTGFHSVTVLQILVSEGGHFEGQLSLAEMDIQGGGPFIIHDALAFGSGPVPAPGALALLGLAGLLGARRRR